MTSTSSTEDALRIQVAEAGQILFRLGLADYLGHCSARVPGLDRIVIKPKHSPEIRGMHRLTASDMVVIDFDGNLLAGALDPPTELFIHTEIYRARPDVNSIVHTHQLASTLMGVISEPVLPILHLPAIYVERDIPIWSCSRLVDGPALGRELATTLGAHAFAHLQGHGIVSVAGDVETATVGAALLEHLAEANMRILSTGRTPRVIPDAEIRALQEKSASVHGRWSYYRQLVEEVDSSSHPS